MYRQAHFGLKVRFMPKEAKEELLEVYWESKCDPVAAAKKLDISWASFENFVTSLGAREKLAKLRAKAEKEGIRDIGELRKALRLRASGTKANGKGKKAKRKARSTDD